VGKKELVVLREVKLGAEHSPTGGTRHYAGNELLPLPASLQVAHYPDGSGGSYLLYLDDEGQWQTDTYHDTVESALGQAEFEFQVRPDEGNIVNG